MKYTWPKGLLYAVLRKETVKCWGRYDLPCHISRHRRRLSPHIRFGRSLSGPQKCIREPERCHARPKGCTWSENQLDIYEM